MALYKIPFINKTWGGGGDLNLYIVDGEIFFSIYYNVAATEFDYFFENKMCKIWNIFWTENFSFEQILFFILLFYKNKSNELILYLHTFIIQQTYILLIQPTNNQIIIQPNIPIIIKNIPINN